MPDIILLFAEIDRIEGFVSGRNFVGRKIGEDCGGSIFC